MASTSSTDPPTPAACQVAFEQGVAYALHLWPALTLAVQNLWGGAESDDKRAWLAGVVVDQFPDLSKPSAAHVRPLPPYGALAADEPEQAYVEELLLQAMMDEFHVNVDDESACEVAEQIIRARAGCLRGKLDEVDSLKRRWEAKTGDKVVISRADDQDSETDWESQSGEEDDINMNDTPPAPRKWKQEPVVDQDGFTQVSRKK